tara:strand:+ start:391 stop:1008 length:618 start_codon:yes stop_codon:yes gene_type:complete
MDTPNKISIIILAAGLSERFKGNKLLVKIDGVPLIRKTVEIYLETNPYEIIVVVGYEQDKIKSALKGLKIKFVFNKKFKEGQGSSVITGILSTNKDSDGYLFGLADQPFVSKETINKLIDSFYMDGNERTLIVAPFQEEKRGNPVLFSSQLRDKLLKIVGDKGARDIYKKINDKFPLAIKKVKVKEINTFYDFDTKQDFENYGIN